MRTDLRRLALTLWLPLLATSCATPTMPADSVDLVPSGEIADLPSPAAPGSGEPRLFVGAAGVHMSWLEPTADGHAVRVATLKGDRWSGAGTVVAADDLFVNWADFPSVVETTGQALVAHWLQRSGPGTYAYDVRMSRSLDGGQSWSEPVSPHDDGTATEHGFVTLVPERDGSVSAVWLDGRETTAAADPGGDGHAGGAMTLRSARVDASGAVSQSALLDARTCDCCQTGAVRVGNDLVVVYRDRSDEEIRDIWTVARRSGQWGTPSRLSHDDWRIPGCPVNGPAIAARGDRIVVAWFALVDGAPEVKATFSDDAGESFGSPLLVERAASTESVTLGRVDAVWIDENTALLTWLTGVGPEGEVRYRTVDLDGTAGAVRTAALTRSSRSSGFPRIALDGRRLVFAWTLPDEAGAEIRVAEMALLEAGR